MENIPRREAIESLLYLTTKHETRYMYAVISANRFCNKSEPQNWTDVKRTFRYLKGTTNYRPTYSKDTDGRIIGCCDADWTTDQDRRLYTAYIFRETFSCLSRNFLVQRKAANSDIINHRSSICGLNRNCSRGTLA